MSGKALKALLVLAFATASGAAHADTVAVTGITGGSAYPFVNSPGNTVGYEFLVNQNITVTALGIFNPSAYTLQGTSTSARLTTTHAVGLWSANGTLLASATVGPANTLINSFYYAGVSSAALLAGQYYFIGAYFDGTHDQYVSGATAITTASAISYLGGTFAQGASLADPTSVADTTNGRFGPSFEFTPTATTVTPEPSSLLLLGTGLAGIASLRRRFLTR